MKRLIITADDFGADLTVNEAVERAHREGVLTAASLMVAAPAARTRWRGRAGCPACASDYTSCWWKGGR